jgi:hypothetical protein
MLSTVSLAFGPEAQPYESASTTAATTRNALEQMDSFRFIGLSCCLAGLVAI